MMTAMDKLTLEMLSKKYPCIPEERLENLKDVGATEEQYERTNENCKKQTDEQLRGQLLVQHETTREHRPERPPLKVAVLGASGAGKSATGNMLLQNKRFKESSGASAETIQEKSFTSSTMPSLTVVDTPGSWHLPVESSKTKHVDLYILVVNLSSPRFKREDLAKIRKLKDFNNILKSRRSILLLTHARGALRGGGLNAYLEEIRGDPLYNLVQDVGKENVMAINNNCQSTYESESQWKAVDQLLGRAYANSSFQPDSCFEMNRYRWALLGGIVLFFVVVGVSIWAGLRSAEQGGTTPPYENSTISTVTEINLTGTTVPGTNVTGTNVTGTTISMGNTTDNATVT